MPVRPLVDVILYWFCSVFGGLFAAVATMALVVRAIEQVELDHIDLVTVDRLPRRARGRTWRERSLRVGLLGYSGNGKGIDFPMENASGMPINIQDRTSIALACTAPGTSTT